MLTEIHAMHRVLISAIKRGPIESVIPQLVNVHSILYGLSSITINDGGCWDFADDLKVLFPNGECRNNREFEPGANWDHGFFLLNGLFYDSECPRGVLDWRNLPLCQRCRRV